MQTATVDRRADTPPHPDSLREAARTLAEIMSIEGLQQEQLKAIRDGKRDTEALYTLAIHLSEGRGEQVSHGWPPPLDLAKLNSAEPQPPKFIISDWLPCGYSTLLAGHGGVGKSAVALFLAVCIAIGMAFFGLQVERRRVMYLSCEDREGVLHWRLSKICRYLGIAMSDLAGWLDIIDLVGHDTILFQPGRDKAITEAYRQLRARITELGTQVLFVDGISDTYNGNENSRAEVKAYVNALLALIPPDEGAVVLVGHVAKMAANTRTAEGYSGSTGWHNSVRARWYLYPESSLSDDGTSERTGDLVLELQKSNLGPTDQAMTFTWDDGAGLFVGSTRGGESHFDRKYRDREETEGIVAAFRTCTDYVPAATMGQRTAYHVLSAQPNFPDSLRSGSGSRKRFWRHIENLRAMRTITESSISRKSDRKKIRVLALGADLQHADNVKKGIISHCMPHAPQHADNAMLGGMGGIVFAAPPDTNPEPDTLDDIPVEVGQ